MTSWARCERCEVREYHPPKGHLLNDKSYQSQKSGSYWIIEFGGRCTKVKPSKETLLEALSLKLPIDPSEEPSEDVRMFFEKWGPLGIYHALRPYYGGTESNWRAHFQKAYTADLPNIHMLNLTEEMPAKEVWRRFHLTQAPSDNDLYLFPLSKTFLQGYFEYWFIVQAELLNLRHAWDCSEKEGKLTLLNNYLIQYLRSFVEVGESGPMWSFDFQSLRDALYGLAASSIVGDAILITCGNTTCGRVFDYRDVRRRVYCSDQCMFAASNNRKKTPFAMKKHSMMENIKRHTIGKYPSVDIELGREVQRELESITVADGINRLEAVEAKYPEVFERIKPGPKSDLGQVAQSKHGT